MVIRIYAARSPHVAVVNDERSVAKCVERRFDDLEGRNVPETTSAGVEGSLECSSSARKDKQPMLKCRKAETERQG